MNEQEFTDVVGTKVRVFLKSLSEPEREVLAQHFEDAFTQSVEEADFNDENDGLYYAVDADFSDAFEYLMEESK